VAGLAGHNGGINAKRRKREAAIIRGEGYVPEIDPAFANIPLERRLVLANQADVQIGEIQRTAVAAANAEYASHKDALELQIVQGQIRDENLISNDGLLKDGDKATFIQKVRTQNETPNQVTADFTALNGGALVLDPYASKDKTRADNLYADAQKRLPPEQLGPLAGAILQQTGVVPQPVVNSIRKGLSSTNPAEVMAAAQTAQRISSSDPAALARRDGGGEAQKAADDFKHYVNNLNLAPADAARRLVEANDPEKKVARKATEPAAKEFVKSLEKEGLANQFDTLFGSEPELGFTPGQALGIQAEFIAIAEDQFYAANGDPEIAKNRAVEEMKRLYGVTELTGRKLVMKHPPERHWPKFEVAGAAQSLAYPAQLQNDIRALDPTADMNSVQLVTTPETDAMVKRGEEPGYAVVYTDANGVLQTIPGKLWRPDFAALREMQSSVDAAAQREFLDKARAGQAQERQQAPNRVQKPEDFMSGNDPVFGDRDSFISPPPPSGKPATMDNMANIGASSRATIFSTEMPMGGAKKLSVKTITANGVVSVEDAEVVYLSAGYTSISSFSNGTTRQTSFDLVNIQTAVSVTVSGLVGGDIVLPPGQRRTINQRTNLFYAEGGDVLTGSAVYDPPSIADGEGETTFVTVTGAVVGDFVDAISFSNAAMSVRNVYAEKSCATGHADFQIVFRSHSRRYRVDSTRAMGGGYGLAHSNSPSRWPHTNQ
jgi:hypothetical protein